MGVAPGGSFLGEESTLQHFREEYSEPGFFDRSPVGEWLGRGGKGLEEQAHEVVLERIRKHDYELPVEQQRELDRIYACAEHDEGLIESYR